MDRETLIQQGESIAFVVRNWLPTEAEVRDLKLKDVVTQEALALALGTITTKQYQVRVPFKGYVDQPRLSYACGDPEIKFHPYSGLKMPVEAWHPTIKAMRDRIVAETGAELNSCLINDYRNGNDSVSWHGDAEVGGKYNQVITVSLGASRTFKFQSNADRKITTTTLHSGDCVVMMATIQQTHKHCIPKEPKVTDRRVSFTFRCLPVERCQ